MKKLSLPFFCFGLLFALLLLGCGGNPEPTPPSSSSPQSPTISPSVLSTFQIDDNLVASVGKKQANKGEKLPFVVVFEEAHNSRVSQLEIAIMLNRLYQNFGLRHLALEGATVENPVPDAAWFHSLPDIGVRREVALQLLGQGEISAAEFMEMAFTDFELHPIEREPEYLVELSDDASIAMIYYLLAIAQTTLTPEQIAQVQELVKQGKQLDAIEYIINANEWTKERYALVRRASPPVTIEENIQLINELEQKAQDTTADVAEYKNALDSARAFFVAAEQRSETMVENTAALLNTYKDAPMAMDIGAAHTAKMTALLDARGISFGVISPLGLLSTGKNGELYTEMYDRKLKQLSVEPAGGLGSFLDSRRKPRPVINQNWLEVKGRLAYLGIVLARAASGGGKPPFGLDKKTLGLDIPGNPSPIDLDLTAIQMEETTDSNGEKGIEVFFPVKFVPSGKVLWMRVGKTTSKTLSTADLTDTQTIEQVLMDLLNQVRQEPEISPAQAKELETKHSADSPAVATIAVDVKAAFANTEDGIKKIKVRG